MSEVKAKKSDTAVATKTPSNGSHQSNPKSGKNKRSWKYSNNVTSAKHKKKNLFALPPKDPQLFSTNWKTFQEAFKMSSNVKNTGADKLDKDQSSSQKKVQKKHSGHIPDKADNVTPTLNSKNKDGPVSFKISESGNQPSASKQPKGPKRKCEDGKVPVETSEHKSKKKGIKNVEEPAVKKPTEEDMWFDDVDPDDIEATVGTEAADIIRRRRGTKTDQRSSDAALVKEHAFEGVTKAVAMDCEMVGVGPDCEESIVARVSLVNQFGKCIYDKYVKPTERVTDYRTAVSGIRPKDIMKGENVKTVQKEVADILQGRILVGHAIHNDLKILFLDHPKKKIRDTQKYKPFKKTVQSGRPSLKLLCEKILHVKVQQGEHSSVQDAQATMRLYTLVKKQWEMDIKARHKNGSTTEQNERKPRVPKSKSK
ncbi:hypothetical protein SKAU_G00359700 [Synaphobranchus kaupii]|uniref:RNA exonuclease 4 n=1 Tax=Synaphobranchus kaupii TaxID=118154 RepID=A0A9Q1EHZ9_SYNKA|nr:hypothetical protein SKAU_G00359700 [Synaphobranchus kaupii]